MIAHRRPMVAPGLRQLRPRSEGRRADRRALVGTGIAVLALLAVALAVRLSLLIRSSWLLEGDDALSALMALGVMNGDRPLMLKNQSYAGAFEPYAMALTFVLFGVSRVAAKLPELVISLGVIGATWLLGREVAGRAAAWFAAILMALPPVYVLVLGIKPWAPYTEVMLFGTLSVTAAVRIAWHDGRRGTSLACGVFGGLAFWMHPLAIWYLTTAAIAIVLRTRGRGLLPIMFWSVLGFALGALPIWIYNILTQGATVRFVLAGTQGQTADRGAVLSAWWNADLPRGAGLWHPWGSSPLWLGVSMAAALALALLWAIVGRTSLRFRPLDAVLLLLAVIPTLYVLSGFGGPALNPYGFDATGRYTPPIWGALAVVLGAALAALWRIRPRLAVLLCLVPVGVNLAALSSIDAVEAFQSPYWDRLPVDTGPLLTALRARNVTAVWVNHWAGQPLMFDAAAAGQRLVAYDWYDVQAGGIDRFPEYRALVENADRAAFILVTDETDPDLERLLGQMAVRFDEIRAPPYLVVIPTSRTVDPSEVTPALDYRY